MVLADAPRASLDTAALPVMCGIALRDILAERLDQVERHGRTLEHDQRAYAGDRRPDLALAAASYANAAIDQLTTTRPGGVDLSRADPMTWPWDGAHWHPRDARTNLVKAAALIWAAIDLLDHAPRFATPDEVPISRVERIETADRFDYAIDDDGVMTALPTWQRDDEATFLRLQLVAVGPIDRATIACWSDEQVQQADIWAWTTHLSAGDHDDIVVPAKPAHVQDWMPFRGIVPDAA